MRFGRFVFSLAALFLLFAIPVSIKAQQNAATGLSGTSDVVTVAPAPVLSNRLAGVKATGEARQFAADNLSEMVSNQAEVFREYHVTSATSRKYGAMQVDLFDTTNRFSAYGLLSYFAEPGTDSDTSLEIGSGSARVKDGLIFHKGNHFVRVTGGTNSVLQARIAQEIAQKLSTPNQDRPTLLDTVSTVNTIAEGRQYKPVTERARYFLGPQSLSSFVEQGRDMFEFYGEAEAVLVEYKPADQAATTNQDLKVLIVEYHTPQFATDAFARVNSYLDSLPDDERNRIAIKREGNYIVSTFNAPDAEFASQLIDSVEYAYTVKWLRNPLLTTNDPFRQQKTAEMLLSTFGILGVILGTVFVFGTVFGTVTFIKRRKAQRQAFSDAGGMVRLDLDPFEATLLGLPPKRSED